MAIYNLYIAKNGNLKFKKLSSSNSSMLMMPPCRCHIKCRTTDILTCCSIAGKYFSLNINLKRTVMLSQASNNSKFVIDDTKIEDGDTFIYFDSTVCSNVSLVYGTGYGHGHTKYRHGHLNAVIVITIFLRISVEVIAGERKTTISSENK